MSRAPGGLCHLTAFRQIGDRCVRIAIVVHQHAANSTVGIDFADEDGEALCRSVEGAFVEQRRADVGADIDDLVLHGALAGRHQIKAAQIGQRHDHRRCDEHRHGELGAAEAGGCHYHQFAVRIELGQGIEHAEEEGDWQDDDQQAGQDQDRQIDEGRRRLPAIDDEVEQPQGLRQPHHAGHQEREQRNGPDQLLEDIERQSRHLAFRSARVPCPFGDST